MNEQLHFLYFMKVKVKLYPDGKEVILRGICFTTKDHKSYLHIRNNDNAEFDWLDEFNKWHEALSKQRGKPYIPVHSERQIKLFYPSEYFAQWKKKWAEKYGIRVVYYSYVRD